MGAGAFNSWLIYLVDFGIVGTALAMAAFVLPCLSSGVRWVLSDPTRRCSWRLALRWARSRSLCIFFFIDLPYSFAWFHAGLALARHGSAWMPSSSKIAHRKLPDR